MGILFWKELAIGIEHYILPHYWSVRLAVNISKYAWADAGMKNPFSAVISGSSSCSTTAHTPKHVLAHESSKNNEKREPFMQLIKWYLPDIMGTVFLCNLKDVKLLQHDSKHWRMQYDIMIYIKRCNWWNTKCKFLCKLFIWHESLMERHKKKSISLMRHKASIHCKLDLMMHFMKSIIGMNTVNTES